jgi:hypothetical protein
MSLFPQYFNKSSNLYMNDELNVVCPNYAKWCLNAG